jgi:predicted transcriptional regulator
MGLRGKKKWSKEQVKVKARWNRTKIRLLKLLKKAKKPLSSEEIASALKISREHANNLLIRLWRQRLVDREPIAKPYFARYPVRLPYLYSINKAGLQRLAYWRM